MTRSQKHTRGEASLCLAGGQGKHAPILTSRVGRGGQRLDRQSEKPAHFAAFAPSHCAIIGQAQLDVGPGASFLDVSSLDLPGLIRGRAFREGLHSRNHAAARQSRRLSHDFFNLASSRPAKSAPSRHLIFSAISPKIASVAAVA